MPCDNSRYSRLTREEGNEMQTIDEVREQCRFVGKVKWSKHNNINS